MSQMSQKSQKTQKSQPLIISIEGNIGSGKSTLVEHLKKKFNSNPKICFLEEPVAIWETIKDVDGNSMLTKYYDNQYKYAFSFQMMAYISRLSLLKRALKEDYDIIITERSIYTDNEVFAKMLHDEKKIEDVEYAIYMRWFHEFLEDLPPLWLIYVKTTPEIALQRVMMRNRRGENIPLSYLENCHKYHENWLNNIEDTPILVLNANNDIRENPYILLEWITDIEQFMFKKT